MVSPYFRVCKNTFDIMGSPEPLNLSWSGGVGRGNCNAYHQIFVHSVETKGDIRACKCSTKLKENNLSKENKEMSC